MSHPVSSSRVTGRDVVLGPLLSARILVTAHDTDGRHDLVEVTMPPGAATPVHVHGRCDECIWVLEGSLTAAVASKTLRLASGEVLSVPRGIPHALTAGPVGVRLLTISSPAVFAEMLTRSGTPAHLVTDRATLDLDRFLHVSEELGDRVLGPPAAPAPVEADPVGGRQRPRPRGGTADPR